MCIKINSWFNQRLLQLFILLIDEREVTYDSFNEYTTLDRPMFSRLIKEYQKMLIKLNLKYRMTKEEIGNPENPGFFKTNIYYLTYLCEDYSFNMSDLTKEEKIKYLYVIVYLMLRNNQYISPKILKERIDIDISESSFKRFLDSFKMLVGFDIYKNKLQSYVIEYD